MRRERIVVAMSGGVDSSVAAALLVEQGHEVIGVSMQLWARSACGSHRERSCCSVQDIEDARGVAARLGIPFYVVDMAAPFREGVMDYFAASYAEGLTPNPCVACNDRVKFGAFLEKAESLDADAVATGHYARIARDETTGRYLLKRGADHSKDQSYVLFGLTQAQLAGSRLPVGAYDKPAIRVIARRWGLRVADKPDSQDICFLTDGDREAFLRERLPVIQPGPIVDVAGRRLGEHRGVCFYTIGQRKGLGIAMGEPVYVVAIEAAANRLVVGPAEALRCRDLVAERANWIAAEPATGASLRATVKIRYNHLPQPATVTCTSAETVRVRFDEPQQAITPGQAVVFYEGDLVLGGGWISRQHVAFTQREEAVRVTCNRVSV